MAHLPITMATFPETHGDDISVLSAYSIDNNEGMTEAIVNAFEAAGIHVSDRPTQLVDWIDVEAVECLQWGSDNPMYLCTRVWKHPVAITAEEIRIYTRAWMPDEPHEAPRTPSVDR